jgi:aryl-alcohol dehydrogenase-like predicted oxidoreductase
LAPRIGLLVRDESQVVKEQELTSSVGVVDDEEEVMTLLKGAYDRGLNTWDTANVYSNGGSFTMP